MAERKKAHMLISMAIENFSKESIEKYKLKDWKESSAVKVAIGDIVTQWSMRIYPNREERESNIGLYLMLKESNSTNFSVSFRLGIRGKSENENLMRRCFKRTGNEMKNSGSYGFPNFISHDELFNESRGLVVDGSIKFVCDLNITAVEPTERDANKQLSNLNQELASDFKTMFEGQIFTDFKLTTNDGEVLTAHKAVLAARSPVFLAMLTTDMQEANENEVNVDDFDSTTMIELLRFIYCNEVDNLANVARDLIYAAEKYELEKLKEICVDSIVSTLTTDNVLKSLIIADQVSKTKTLFDDCLESIIQNFDVISKTEGWKELPNDILTNVIQKMISRHSKQIIVDVTIQPF